jgi:hypothetical protein
MVGLGGDAHFSELVSEVVLSRQFRSRLGKETGPLKTAAVQTRNSNKAGTP